jgi:hypothetical protein
MKEWSSLLTRRVAPLSVTSKKYKKKGSLVCLDLFDYCLPIGSAD